MSNDPSVPSSDLGRARSSARRLRGATTPSSRTPGPLKPPRYVRFDARRFGTLSVTTGSDGGSAAPGSPTDHWGSDTWTGLLDDCLRIAQGSSAFLMDEHGLVVAVRGGDESDMLEVLGARLTVTFQQADRMSHREGGTTTICIELDDGWLTGIKHPMEGSGPLVVGILAADPIAGDAKSEIMELIAAAISAFS